MQNRQFNPSMQHQPYQQNQQNRARPTPKFNPSYPQGQPNSRAITANQADVEEQPGQVTEYDENEEAEYINFGAVAQNYEQGHVNFNDSNHYEHGAPLFSCSWCHMYFFNSAEIKSYMLDNYDFDTRSSTAME